MNYTVRIENTKTVTRLSTINSVLLGLRIGQSVTIPAPARNNWVAVAQSINMKVNVRRIGNNRVRLWRS